MANNGKLKGDLTYVKKELEKIDLAMQETEQRFSALTQKVHPSNLKNARNLLHYLALRSLDIRDLQESLHAVGLSSLASSENHIRGQLQSILKLLGKQVKTDNKIFTYQTGKESLKQKAAVLFGQRRNEYEPYIMVTFETDLATNYRKVKKLLQEGMNIARINCAHDDEKVWLGMIRNIHRACKATGRSCKIYMDLAGPKIRTVLKGRKKLKVYEGQQIFLTDEKHLKKTDKNTIGCTIPGVVGMLKPGETVLFDDGVIEARVDKADTKRAALNVLRISCSKPYIKKEKGINFPSSNLNLPALTEYDRQCLPFVLKYADMAGYSFVNNAKDLMELKEAMGSNKKTSLIIKIETPEAVKNLPALLFCAMQNEHFGIMVARGDLAVQIGFERMSEIQDEIVWICEAGHVPVIWATQVLETLNKSGMATRSEITDAAHAALADCVMINKGRYTIKVMKTLKDIFSRSGGHHVKKRFIFRPLMIAKRFMEEL